MTITIQQEPDNHEAVIAAVVGTRRFQIFVVPRIVGGALLALALFLGLLLFQEAPELAVGCGFVAAVGLLTFLQPLWTMAAIRRRMARYPQEPSTITITTDGVATVTPSANSSYVWSYVTSVTETDDLMIVRRFRVIISVWRKSKFTPDDLAAVRAHLATLGLRKV